MRGFYFAGPGFVRGVARPSLRLGHRDGKADPRAGRIRTWAGRFRRAGITLAVSRRMRLIDFAGKGTIHAFADEGAYAGAVALSGNGKKLAAMLAGGPEAQPVNECRWFASGMSIHASLSIAAKAMPQP